MIPLAILWHVVATACMSNATADCFTQQLARTHPSYGRCIGYLANPYDHAYQGPLKVMGSHWTSVRCRPARVVAP